MRTRVTAQIRIVSTLFFLVVRLVAITFIDNLAFFLAVYVLEALVAGVWIVVRYRIERMKMGFRLPSRSIVGGLTKQSLPLFLSSTMNQINLRGDVVFIQAILGSSSVGLYAAAARMSEIAYFLPTVFMDATLPSLVKLHEKHGHDGVEFRRVMQRSYDRAFWIGLAIAVAIGVVGSLLIDIFFDPIYQASKPLLWISLAACPFIFMSAVYSKWILTINTLWSSVVRHTSGAALNIALNLLLLPAIGIVGASIASLSSYIVASYLACFIGTRTRIAGWQMTLAIVAPVRFAVRRLSAGHTSKDN
jgi:O-antigen/teichoic acid export membrane protein